MSNSLPPPQQPIDVPLASSPSPSTPPSKYAILPTDIPADNNNKTVDRTLQNDKIQKERSMSRSLDTMLDLGHLHAASTTNNKTTKEKVWDFMDEAGSSRGASFLAMFIMFLIAISCLNFIVETLPSVQVDSNALEFLRIVESICSGLFTVEYIVRFFSCPNKFKFVKEFLSIIDLLAILPFYIEIIQNSLGAELGIKTSFIRIVRLVRIVRVLKVSKYLTWFRLFGSALAKSAQPLAMLFFIIMICMIFFSSIMFTVERGDWSFEHKMWVTTGNVDVPSPYQSIPDAFYWCIITMTTVGYGDAYPFTAIGKIIAVAASLLGILVLAIPITVISTNFNAEYEKIQKQQEIIRARMMLLKQHFAQKRSGLDALKSEIRDLGKRSTSELLGEMHKIVEKSQEVLCEELTETVRIAYLERQKELEHAGFASEAEAKKSFVSGYMNEMEREGVSIDEEDENDATPTKKKDLVSPVRTHTPFRESSLHAQDGHPEL